MKHLFNQLIIAFLSINLVTFGYMPNASAAISNLDRSQIGAGNQLTNPSGVASTAGYTASGGTFTTGGSGSGTYFSWDSNAAGQTVTSGYQTVSSGDPWSGRNGSISAAFKCDSGTCTHKLQVYDGTNVLAEATIYSSTTSFVPTTVNFIYPQSGVVAWRVVSVASDEPKLYWREGYQGIATNLTTVSPITTWQSYTPTFVGFGTVTGISVFWRQVGDSLELKGGFTTGTPTATTLQISLPAGDVIDTLKTGAEEVVGQFNRSAAATGYSALATSSDTTNIRLGSNANGTSYLSGSSLGSSEYETFTARVPIVGWSASASGVKPDQSPASWSGTSTLTGTVASASITDPGSISGSVTPSGTPVNITCSAASSLLGVTCNVPKAGSYHVCYTGYGTISIADTIQSELTDGSNNVIVGLQSGFIGTAGGSTSLGGCSNYTASLGSNTFKIRADASGGTGTIYLTSFSITDNSSGSGFPQILNSITTNSSGQEHVERATLPSGCGSVTSQSGAWVSGTSHPTTGQCSLTIASGEFSATPTCVASALDSGANQRYCSVSNSLSSTSATVSCGFINAGSFSQTDIPFTIICMGPR